jgi:hypothetical protein
MDRLGKMKRELRDQKQETEDLRTQKIVITEMLLNSSRIELELERKVGQLASRGCPALKKEYRYIYGITYSCLLRKDIHMGHSFRQHFCSICKLRKQKNFEVKVMALKLKRKSRDA